jgi:hypothetical protein
MESTDVILLLEVFFVNNLSAPEPNPLAQYHSEKLIFLAHPEGRSYYDDSDSLYE